MAQHLNSANEENFTLIRSFNDVFVTMASLLVVLPLCYMTYQYVDWLGFLVASVLCWLLAEVFTRRRRMALPSIVFAFLCPAFFGITVCITLVKLTLELFAGTSDNLGPWDSDLHGSIEIYMAYMVTADWRVTMSLVIGFLSSAIVSYAFWRRFHVPISIAGCTLALVAAVLTTAFGVARIFTAEFLPGFFLVFGLGTLAYAIYWDQKDKQRVSYESDVAFWLHIFAAPMLVSAVMASVVNVGQSLEFGGALAVLAIFVLLAIVALLLDRRAILVASIAYVFSAFNTLLSGVDIRLAVSLLALGVILLCLSIWWRLIRDTFIALLPSDLANQLPD